MAATSPAQQAIDTMIRLGPQPMLKARGYRKVRRSFYLEADDVFREINFQASQWGTANAGSFTINLSVKQPYFHQMFTGEDVQRSPTSMIEIVGERIGMLMPAQKDLWFDVTSSTDLDALAEEIVAVIEKHALPYFDRLGGVDKLLDAFERDKFPARLHGRQMAHVILLCFKGQQDRAATLLAKLRQDPDYALWSPLNEIARRLRLA